MSAEEFNSHLEVAREKCAQVSDNDLWKVFMTAKWADNWSHLQDRLQVSNEAVEVAVLEELRRRLVEDF